MSMGLSLGLDLTGVPVEGGGGGSGHGEVSENFSSLTPDPFAVDGDWVDSVDLDVHAADENDADLAYVPTTIAQEIVRPSVANCAIQAAGTVEVDTVTSVTITIRDASGNPIPDVDAGEIAFASTGTGNTLVQATGRTNEIGQVYGTFESSVEEVKTLSATLEDVTGTPVAITITAEITVGDPDPPPPLGDPFAVMGTTAGTTRDTSGGLTFDLSDAQVSEQAVPAGRTGYGLRMRYGAGGNAEQYIDLGRQCTELWVSYDLYVPANFAHANVFPQNNKFAMFWRTVYSDVANGTWRVGFEYTTNSSTTPNSNIRGMSSRWNYNSWDSANPYGDYAPTGQSSTLISPSGPLVIGAWNTVRIHLKRASSASGTDGVQQMQINGVTNFSITTGKFWNYTTGGGTPADCWLGNMYLFGAANVAYAEVTDFYIYGGEWFDTDPGWVF